MSLSLQITKNYIILFRFVILVPFAKTNIVLVLLNNSVIFISCFIFLILRSIYISDEFGSGSFIFHHKIVTFWGMQIFFRNFLYRYEGGQTARLSKPFFANSPTTWRDIFGRKTPTRKLFMYPLFVGSVPRDSQKIDWLKLILLAGSKHFEQPSNGFLKNFKFIPVNCFAQVLKVNFCKYFPKRGIIGI